MLVCSSIIKLISNPVSPVFTGLECARSTWTDHLITPDFCKCIYISKLHIIIIIPGDDCQSYLLYAGYSNSKLLAPIGGTVCDEFSNFRTRDKFLGFLLWKLNIPNVKESYVNLSVSWTMWKLSDDNCTVTTLYRLDH